MAILNLYRILIAQDVEYLRCVPLWEGLRCDGVKRSTAHPTCNMVGIVF